MRTKRRFTETEVLLRRLVLLAHGDDWHGSGKVVDLLDDVVEHLAETAACPGDLGESQELPC